MLIFVASSESILIINFQSSLKFLFVKPIFCVVLQHIVDLDLRSIRYVKQNFICDRYFSQVSRIILTCLCQGEAATWYVN